MINPFFMFRSSQYFLNRPGGTAPGSAALIYRMLYKFSVAYCLINRKLQTKEYNIFTVVLIYDMSGGRVKSISISHRVYGRISAEMDIRSRQDVCEFIERLENSQSTLLGNATSGYHYHLVEAASEDRLDLIEKHLEEAGFLVPLLPWETGAFPSTALPSCPWAAGTGAP